MNSCSKDILNHIFTFFNKKYLPYLRLVCKKWSILIKYREINYLEIIEDSISISENFIQEIMKFVRFPRRYFMTIMKKPYYEGKIDTLDYLYAHFKDSDKYISIDNIDNETTQWLKNKKFNRITMAHWNQELINHYQLQGTQLMYYRESMPPLNYINNLTVSKQKLAEIYAYYDMTEKLSQLEDINYPNTLSVAIYGKSYNCIRYLSNNYPSFAIDSYHYWIHRKYKDIESENFINFLLNLNNRINPSHWFFELPFKVVDKLIKMFPIKQLWNCIFYSRIDICDLLEEKNVPKPNNMTLHLENFINMRKNQNYLNMNINIDMLEWCHKRNITLSQKFISKILKYSHNNLTIWLIDHGYKLDKNSYLNVIHSKSYPILKILKEMNIKPNLKSLNKMKRLLKYSPNVLKWINENF